MKKLSKETLPIHDLSPGNDLSLRLRYLPLEVRNDYDFSEPHRHNYYEVFFFTKGGGEHLVDFVQHEIADHSIHLVRPGQVHLLHRALQSHGAVIHFSKETPVHLQPVYDALQQAAPVTEYTAEAYHTIRVILQLLKDELEGNDTVQDTALACLNLLLLKSIRSESQGKAGPGHQFTEFRKLAEEQYRAGRQPAWYATQLHITEKRLNELCKDATGHTVSHYLTERLVLEAKRLLGHGDDSIKEIGYYLGFEDPAYFTRFFRKNAGITAGDFRKRYKQ